jgi:hypothetical protein
MNIFDEIKKLDVPSVLRYAFVFISTFSPGLLTLQIFFPHLVANYDIVKVLLLSLSISIPIFMTHLLAIMLFLNKPNKHDAIDVGEIAFTAIVFTFLTYYALLAWFYYYSLDFRQFLKILFKLEVALFIFSILWGMKNFCKKRKSRKSPD